MYIKIILIIASTTLPQMLFDFTKDVDLSQWYILDDGVMGGLSQGNFTINDEGHGVYYGEISLDNYGGFSSLRYQCDKTQINNNTHIQLKVKGDGKKYQIRIKANRYDRHAYIYFFETTGDWETIKVPIHEMYASFRGRKLNMPKFDDDSFDTLTILFGNKKEEKFMLEIDNISLVD